MRLAARPNAPFTPRCEPSHADHHLGADLGMVRAMPIFDDDFMFGPLKRMLAAIEKHVSDPSETAALEREVEAACGIPLGVIDNMPADSVLDMFKDGGKLDAPKAALVGTALRRRRSEYREQGQLLRALRSGKAGDALVAAALEVRPDLADLGLA